jgi:aryl carrier-like protein
LVAGVWGDVLQVAAVPRTANFFELGGHSLRAAQVVARLRAALGVAVTLPLLFEAPTVAALAAALETHQRQAHGVAAPPLRPVPRDQPLPLSFAQQRLWFLHQLHPDSTAYHIVRAVRIRGTLDLAALGATFEYLVERHHALRTVFPSHEGRPVQVVLPAHRFDLTVRHLAAAPEGTIDAEIGRSLARETPRPFDLAREPSFRATLLALAADDHVLVVSMHHIISDGWSMRILITELMEVYDAIVEHRSPQLDQLPIQYADFAAWQRASLGDGALAPQLEYWTSTLRGAAPVLDLRTDSPRPAVQRFQGGHAHLAIGADVTAAAKVLCRTHGVTMFVFSLAAFTVLLRHHAQTDDIVIGINVAGRDRIETERVIGLFVNQLVLRTRVNEDETFATLLGRVRRTMLDAHANQDVPFDQLVTELAPERHASHLPLCQVLLTFDVPASEWRVPTGLNLSLVGADSDTSKFDLSMAVVDLGDTLSLALEYDRDLFHADTAGRMVRQYDRLAALAVQQPHLTVGALRAALLDLERDDRAKRAREVEDMTRHDLRRLRDRTSSVPRQ